MYVRIKNNHQYSMFRAFDVQVIDYVIHLIFEHLLTRGSFWLLAQRRIEIEKNLVLSFVPLILYS